MVYSKFSCYRQRANRSVRFQKFWRWRNGVLVKSWGAVVSRDNLWKCGGGQKISLPHENYQLLRMVRMKRFISAPRLNTQIIWQYGRHITTNTVMNRLMAVVKRFYHLTRYPWLTLVHRITDESQLPLVSLEGYDCFFVNRTASSHGGLITYVDNDFEVSVIKKIDGSTIWEGLFIELKHSLVNKIIIGNIKSPQEISIIPLTLKPLLRNLNQLYRN